ncbi:uncharacterized protein LOC119280633 isoform X2 [Triticum dicoccoides]|uniref:uncharacterized protein LOC119280633 isoform X2 n=1 Tax=Triticum dicoccoides TaxID=85692 RepID=UPI00188E1056|nr:uncharacterized protein LOC119280633 isoform X2 [Triticum dicoccoides]
MSKEQKDLKKKGKGGGAICMSREGIENQLVSAALKGATRKREISVHDMKMIRRHFHDDINITVVCLQWHLGRHQIMVWWTTSSGSCSRCRRMAAARRASSPGSPPSSSTMPTGSSTTSAACWTPAEPSHHSPPRPSLVTCRARFFLPRTILSFASTAGGRASHAPTGAWRELLSTTPATGTWKTQSTVPPMNKS